MKTILMTPLMCGGLMLTGASHMSGATQPLLSIQKSNQTVAIQCVAQPARIYRLQSSPILPAQSWSDRTTGVTDGRGLFSWVETIPKDQPSCFYRLLQSGVLGGVVAKHQVSLMGGAYIDSYNSADPNQSTGGLYDPAKRGDHAQVLTDSRAVGAVTVSSSHIYGEVSTGPGGTVVCGSGAIGDLAWNASQSGIEPGHVHDDANVTFQDISAPFASGAAPLPGTFNGTSYTYMMGTGNYQISSLDMSGQGNMAVAGNAVLYVTGDVALAGMSYIYIAPGASLQLYIAGNLTISGKGIINGTQRAANCSVFGLPSCTSMNFAGTSTFY